jgi:hypothetical protein
MLVVIQEVEKEGWVWAASRSERTSVRPGPDHPVDLLDSASSISLRRQATHSAAGIARASGGTLAGPLGSVAESPGRPRGGI